MVEPRKRVFKKKLLERNNAKCLCPTSSSDSDNHLNALYQTSLLEEFCRRSRQQNQMRKTTRQQSRRMPAKASLGNAPTYKSVQTNRMRLNAVSVGISAGSGRNGNTRFSNNKAAGDAGISQHETAAVAAGANAVTSVVKRIKYVAARCKPKDAIGANAAKAITAATTGNSSKQTSSFGRKRVGRTEFEKKTAASAPHRALSEMMVSAPTTLMRAQPTIGRKAKTVTISHNCHGRKKTVPDTHPMEVQQTAKIANMSPKRIFRLILRSVVRRLQDCLRNAPQTSYLRDWMPTLIWSGILAIVFAIGIRCNFIRVRHNGQTVRWVFNC